MIYEKYNFIIKITTVFSLIFVAFVVVFYTPEQAHAASWFGEPIYQVLGNTGSGMGKITSDVWTVTMNVVNSFVLALLIYVAFMNILRIQMDSYAVKKFLPTFIMTIILANFSFLIARIIIDLGNIAISIFLTGNQQNNLSGAFDELIKQKPIKPGDEGQGANYYAIINAYIFKQFFVIAGAVMMFILSFVFLFRNYMLYFLIAIAPLGFLAMALPITKKYFQQWWGTFTKWVFMPVVSVFWLWLGGQFVTAIGNDSYWILPVAFGGLCLYMAITSPFKIGGAAIGAWGKLGKQAWGKTGGAAWKATGGAAIKSGKDYVNWQYNTGKQRAINWSKDRLPVVRPIARAGERFKIKKEITEAKFKKVADTRRELAVGETIASKTTDEWERDPVAYSRLKNLLGSMVREKASGDDYRNQMTNADHAGQIGYVNDGGVMRIAEKDDFFYRPDTVVKWDGSSAGITEKNRTEKMVESAASATELLRRKRSRSANIPDREGAAGLEGQDPADIVEDRLISTIKDLRTLERRPAAAAAGAAPTSGTPTSGGSASSPILGFDGRPYRPVEGAGEPGESAQERDSELAGYMQELVSEFRNLEEQLGGQGSLGGEGGYDQLLGKISKMKPNLTLSDAGLAAVMLPVRNVRIESIDPTALEQWGRKIRQVSERVNEITAGIEAENASVLRQIATVIRDGANPSKLAEGRQAIGEAADTNEGEGNG